MSDIYSLEGVIKRRGGGERVFELVVPRLHVSAGEFVAVLGDSGCGKSTLLDMLGLVSRPDTAVRFDIDDGTQRHDVTGLSDAALAGIRRRRLGYVLQQGGLLPFFSVAGNAGLAQNLAGGQASPGRLEALAASLGISGMLKRKPSQMSGGQRQRAAVLRALAHNPAVVLADEPTASVDKATAKSMVALLADLAKRAGAAIVMVTHDQDLILDLADRVYGFTLETDGAVTRSTCAERIRA